ncbi:Uncharacterized protein NEOC65_001768 [Neochlamydia sp. AcF65]|uniref:hypothetical protein n=1 Tax=Neochlamydia sp. AcF65 TaxID=2795735 RepID=UPI001BC96FD4|nr:hypothetical protein [Neochlamydia sp. AcF65]MBS4166675.1 Uncharacterized protein [Neochlamydia sp. AcF65]
MLKSICFFLGVACLSLTPMLGAGLKISHRLHAIHFGPGPTGDQGQEVEEEKRQNLYAINFGPGPDGDQEVEKDKNADEIV